MTTIEEQTISNLERTAAKLREQFLAAQAKADAERTKQKAAQERKQRSQKAVNQTIERYVDARLLQGTLTPKLVQAHVSQQSNPAYTYLDLAHRLLSDPVYGLHRGPYGEFIYQNQKFDNPRAVQLAIESYLGAPPASLDYIDSFMREVLTGENADRIHAWLWDVAAEQEGLALPDEELTMEDNFRLRALLDMDVMGDDVEPRESLKEILEKEGEEPPEGQPES